MTLRFMYGRAGLDHERLLVHQIKSDLRQHPADHYFYLVPNHIKFKSEVDVLNRLDPFHHSTYAQMNVQILSLTRLAWYFLNQTPQNQLQWLSTSGVNMLLYQIIQDQERQGHLEIFQGEKDRPGFITKLADQINETRLGQVSAVDLAKITKIENNWNVDLKHKMHDFIVIDREFERLTQHRYAGKADTLDLLYRYLRSPRLGQQLAHDHFYISGFSQFTAQEENLVKLLIRRSASVLIDLDLLHPAPDRLPRRPNLFYQPALLYRRLYRFARLAHVKICTDLPVRKAGVRVSPDLMKLDRFWERVNERHPVLKTESLNDPNSIQVVRASNRYAEVAAVALMIRRMVATGRYRYSDFLVMSRHLDRFQNVIRPVFRAQKIPFFDDVQKSMASHPLVRLIEDLFKINDPQQTIHYRYQDVMDLLKTGLLVPRGRDGRFMKIGNFRDALALTENLVLAKGYFSDQYGNPWTQDHDWLVTRFNHASDFGKRPALDRVATRKVNVIRHFVKRTLPPFYQHLYRAKTGRAAAEVLYRFLVHSGVTDRLRIWRQKDAAGRQNHGGDLTAANEISQVWTAFCQLLDNFVNLLGDRRFLPADFLGLLKAGFEGAIYSQIPSTLDQVIISESGIVQMNDYKVVFMIGSTDDVMPDHIVNEALFNDYDRRAIQPDLNNSHYFNDHSSRYLNENSEERMAGEPYLNYLAFMSASRRIIFTYSLNRDDNSQSNLSMSPYVRWIKHHFQLKEQTVTAPRADKSACNFVGTRLTTLRHLVQAAYDSKRNHRPMAADWDYLYGQLKNSPLTDRLLGGLDYDNQPVRLDPQIVVGLYGSNIDSSISQLEQFYNDPYEYFLRFGLRLKPRQLFELSSAGTGSFYHELMDYFVKLVNHRGWDLAKLTSEQITNCVKLIVRRILGDPGQPQYQILKSSYRMHFIRQQLEHVIRRMLMTLKIQSHYTPMRPRQTEVPFGLPGTGTKLRPLNLWTDSRHLHQIRVHGRIDRIDVMRTPSRDFLSVVDYKSSQHAFDYGSIYSGNEMQMMTYLDVLQDNLQRLDPTKRAEVAGALYSWIHLPDVSLSNAQRDPDRAVLLDQKYRQVLLVDDPQLLTHFDKSMARPKQRSLIYPLRRDRKNSIHSKRYLISRADLRLILMHTRRLIQRAGAQIYRGDIALSPVRFDYRKTLLRDSPYRAIMQFDPLLPDDRYRDVSRMQLSRLIELLKGRLNHEQTSK